MKCQCSFYTHLMDLQFDFPLLSFTLQSSCYKCFSLFPYLSVYIIVKAFPCTIAGNSCKLQPQHSLSITTAAHQPTGSVSTRLESHMLKYPVVELQELRQMATLSGL